MSDDNDSTSLWAKMLGLGPILQVAQSPDFQNQVSAFVCAVADTQRRCENIERKLDYLLHLLQQGSALDALPPVRPALLTTAGPDGTGGPAAASRVTDDGAGQHKKRA